MTFPINNDNSVQDAVNYLLSGPSGLGQFFNGFSDYNDSYFTGNYRPPFTNTNSNTNLYVVPIPLSTSELLDPRTFKFTFASTQSFAPFAVGEPISVNGTSNPDLYDGGYAPIGVVECTTTYVICRTNSSYSGSPATGGTVTYSNTTIDTDPNNIFFISTDCNAKVLVNGAGDRVFISAQLNNVISFETTTDPSAMQYIVSVNRYYGVLNNDPTNPDYRFIFDKTISQKKYVYDGLNNSVSPIDPLGIDTIFTSIIDSPSPGYYWYILEVAFNSIPDPGTGVLGNLQVTNSKLQLRSLSAQVVKQ